MCSSVKRGIEIKYHPSTHPYTTYVVKGHGGAGADPSCHWARGRLYPEQVYHRADRERKTITHTHTYRQLGVTK